MTEARTILFNVASQTLHLDCPEGQPSSVTAVTVHEDTGADASELSALTGSATIDSVDTTLDDAAGATASNPTLIPLTSTTGIVVGRSYVVTNALGQSERVEVVGISANVSVLVRNPLVRVYASGAAFKSTRVSVTVDTTWAANASNVSDPLCPRPRYRVAWTYVVGGATYRVATFFDLVRYPWTTTVSPADVDRLARGFLHKLSPEDRAGEALIAEALHQVKLDLWERNLTAYAQRHSDAVNELVRRKAVALVMEQAARRGAASTAAAEADARLYWERLDNLIAAAKSAQQVTPSGAGAPSPRALAWRR